MSFGGASYTFNFDVRPLYLLASSAAVNCPSTLLLHTTSGQAAPPWQSSEMQRLHVHALWSQADRNRPALGRMP